MAVKIKGAKSEYSESSLVDATKDKHDRYIERAKALNLASKKLISILDTITEPKATESDKACILGMHRAILVLNEEMDKYLSEAEDASELLDQLAEHEGNANFHFVSTIQ